MRKVIEQNRRTIDPSLDSPLYPAFGIVLFPRHAVEHCVSELSTLALPRVNKGEISNARREASEPCVSDVSYIRPQGVFSTAHYGRQVCSEDVFRGTEIKAHSSFALERIAVCGALGIKWQIYLISAPTSNLEMNEAPTSCAIMCCDRPLIQRLPTLRLLFWTSRKIPTLDMTPAEIVPLSLDLQQLLHGPVILFTSFAMLIPILPPLKGRLSDSLHLLTPCNIVMLVNYVTPECINGMARLGLRAEMTDEHRPGRTSLLFRNLQ